MEMNITETQINLEVLKHLEELNKELEALHIWVGCSYELHAPFEKSVEVG